MNELEQAIEEVSEERKKRNLSLPYLAILLSRFKIDRKTLKDFEKKRLSPEENEKLVDLYQRVFDREDEEVEKENDPKEQRKNRKVAQQFIQMTAAMSAYRQPPLR